MNSITKNIRNNNFLFIKMNKNFEILEIYVTTNLGNGKKLGLYCIPTAFKLEPPALLFDEDSESAVLGVVDAPRATGGLNFRSKVQTCNALTALKAPQKGLSRSIFYFFVAGLFLFSYRVIQFFCQKFHPVAPSTYDLSKTLFRVLLKNNIDPFFR